MISLYVYARVSFVTWYLYRLHNLCNSVSGSGFLKTGFPEVDNKYGRRLYDFKMDVIKWQLNFVSCNFGLKLISNRTCAARSFDFEITRMISDQIAPHSVQLPLLNRQMNRQKAVTQVTTFRLFISFALHVYAMNSTKQKAVTYLTSAF